MIDSVEIEDLKNGTCRIWCQTIEKSSIITSLPKHMLLVEEEADVIYSVTPPSERVPGKPVEERPVTSFVLVSGSFDDVSFALNSMVKMIRPYPHRPLSH